jgi:hypothetical protein
VELQDEFEETDGAKDPLRLVELIKRVHLTAPTSNPARTKAQRIKVFAKLHQKPDEHIRNYIQRFKEAVDGMTFANLEPPGEDVQAAIFIEGLDEGRFGDMQEDLINNSITGSGEYPETLNAAIAVAQQYVVRSKTGHGNVQAAFVIKAEPKNKLKPSSEDKNKPKAAGGGGPASVVCWNCGEEGHIRPDCPELAKSDEEEQKEEKKKKNKPKKKPKKSSEAKELHFADTDMFEDSFPIMSEDPGQETGEIISPAVESFQKLGRYDDHVVHLDNQATASLFKNESLLHDVKREENPIRFRGV